MANVNVDAALDRAYKDLLKALQQIKMYSGINKKKALMTDNTASQIAQLAVAICVEAREVMGDKSAGRLLRDVRKALGYTVP
jgi:hypothetical protein